MSRYTARLQQRDFSEFIAIPSLTLRPMRWSWLLPGGPDYAEIEAAGKIDDLWSALQFLRCPVTIRNENGTPVWWGYVAEVSFAVAGVSFAVSLERMRNRVAVAYSYVAPGTQDVGERRTTSWAENTISISEWGQKEYLESVDGASDALAEGVRDEILNQSKYPRAVPSPVDRDAPARLICRGWWHTLAWRYYAKSDTDSIETTTQIATIVAEVGEFFTGADIVDASGVSSSEYRDGDSTALAEIEAMLYGLTATVTRERILRVEAEPSSGNDDWLLLPGGRFATRLNATPEPGQAIFGWTQLRGVIPASANLGYMAAPSPFFIEENEYDAERDEYRWRERGQPSAWELARMQGG